MYEIKPGDIPPSHTGGIELTALILVLVAIGSLVIAVIIFSMLGLLI